MAQAEEPPINNSTKNAIRFLVLAACLGWVAFSFSNDAEASELRYFTLSEFADRETGQVYMDPVFLKNLDRLRALCGFPIYINSGYRSPEHSIEKVKEKPGTHSKGIAVDIEALTDYEKNRILKYAIQLGFKGIGIYPQHIHLDTRKAKTVLWVQTKYY